MADWLDDVIEAIGRQREMKTSNEIGAMECLGEVMRNFDHQVDLKIWGELEARPNETYAAHTARNFIGYVWHDGATFQEEVWRHGKPIASYTGGDPADLFQIVNEEHGSD